MAGPVTNTLARVAGVLGLKTFLGVPAAATWDGLIPFSWPWNYWQTGRNPYWAAPNAAVEACVSAISQSIAMMPANHWRETADGGRERITTSPAYRVLRRPNDYQTRAEFVVNLLRCELLQGNGYAQARRDDRFQITELHLAPPRYVAPYIDPDSGAVYYQIGGNPISDAQDAGLDYDPNHVIPARDVLHIRLHGGRNPLQGETPLTAAATAVAAGNAIAGHNATFFRNMSRPSGVLQTDQNLTAAQVQELRARWLEASAQENTGGVPMLTAGLKWTSLTMTATDTALIASYDLTVADIARVFRVPPPIIGDLKGATFSNTETLLRHWIATGLGYVIEHLEQAFDHLFKLAPGEWIEFDTDYLLRSEFLTRIDALTKGISGGLFAPNEARTREGLSAVKGGDTVYVQQQLQRLEDRAANIPLDAGRVTPPPTLAPQTAPSADDEKAWAAFLTRALHEPVRT